MKMENNSNESFTLTEKQIRFIDNGFLNKKKELKDVVEKLVKQQDNNFQKEDVAQIMESYIKVKRRKAKQRNEWTQEQEEKLTEAIKKEFEEKGEGINIRALARKLKKTKELEDYSDGAIANKISKTMDDSEEYRRIKPKRNRSEWTQEQEEKLTEVIRKEIEKKCENINIAALARRLKKTKELEDRNERVIIDKMYQLMKKFKCNQENNNKINEDLAKRLEEVLNNCFNDTEQLNNAENHLVKINTLENDKSNNSNTSDHSSLSNIMSDFFPNESSSSEHSK